jgi:small subunit ribosomal protein S9
MSEKTKKPKVHKEAKEQPKAEKAHDEKIVEVHVEKAAEKKAEKTVEKTSEKPAEKKAEKHEKKFKPVFTIGKRKRSVARASLRQGSGIVMVNARPIEIIEPEMHRLKMQEPLIIAGDVVKGFDINVNITGGGVLGQTEAARQAIARALVGAIGGDLKKKYQAYDRNLLVYDPRRTEPHKPPRSSQGPRRYKQRSKR